ncbi:MAG: hypothetical protein H6744_06605 [Deltaproteobacteria bacterium]|nr:hypothetical protein [Deltaproteobacteria bacterium]MCB9786352.1 hypothetical protein [Deltaproteobacteria bacterium]
MIDYDGKRWGKVALQLHGSVIPGVLPRVLLAGALGAVAALAHSAYGFSIPPIAHTLVGVALGLLLVFRTNASFDRYWEGRKLVGQMVNRCRDLARQAETLLDPAADGARARFRRLVPAWFALTRQHLRAERELEALGAQLTEDERATLGPVTTRPLTVATWLGRALAEEARAGRLSEQRIQLFDQNLTALADTLGGCERIVRTPIPFAYAQHIKSFLLLFCYTAPFAMAESMGWHTPMAALVLAYALFGIDEIGVEIEDPFGYDPNDLAMDGIGETIGRDVAEILADG